MLKVDIKSKIYKMKNENFKALDNVKLEINDNGIVCILGPSGSGKTTLMNIIGALDSDFDGDVVINNKSIKEFKSKDLDSYRKNTIGFIFQQFYLINKLSAYDNVKVALNLSNDKDKKNKVMDLLKKVEMDRFAKRKVNLLSGGQKQRIAIARALANDPDIILADEPTGALDSKMSLEIMNLLKELSKTKLILIITHSQELTQEYANTIIKMEDGKVINIEDEKEKVDKKPERELIKDKSKSNMSSFKAFAYSFKNILKRKARTIATSIGMSIGIIGIGLAFAMSNGAMNIAKSQIESIMPTNMIEVTQKTSDGDRPAQNMYQNDESKLYSFADIDNLKKLNSNVTHYWIVPSNAYKDFFSEVSLSKDNANSTEVEPTSFYTQNGFEPYENVKGNLTLGVEPKNEKETVISLNTAEYLMKIDGSLKLADLIGRDVYMKFGPMASYGQESDKNEILSFKIVGITSINTMGYSMYQNTLDTLKLYETLYSKTKEEMKYAQAFIYLDKDLSSSKIEQTINDLNAKQDKFKLVGAASTTISNVETVFNVIKNVLIGFSSISVIVAVLMIGIVIYISVIERVSEIGILRAIGARKKDIRNIFISEAVLIGLLSGLIGVGLTILISQVINKAITGILQGYGMNMGNVSVASLDNTVAVGLIACCVILSAIAGLIPSLKAAKMDPIVALRRS